MFSPEIDIGSPKSSMSGSSNIVTNYMLPKKTNIVRIRNILKAEMMYLASNHQVFQKNKKRSKNVLEKLLGQIKRLKNLPRNHKVYIKMIHISIHPQVVEHFMINQKIR